MYTLTPTHEAVKRKDVRTGSPPPPHTTLGHRAASSAIAYEPPRAELRSGRRVALSPHTNYILAQGMVIRKAHRPTVSTKRFEAAPSCRPLQQSDSPTLTAAPGAACPRAHSGAGPT
ncbi:hypothetical protein GCM10020221_21220 [Streptomyces thioluteus]|uniref:Uncharacterized protein n=1 Tax=Streptomyces thioluteus TaxID=66431 RepID=A0ABN3WR82_STRTU